MSDEPLPNPPRPAPRSGCLTAFMAIVGVILLLPGVCSFFFAVMMIGEMFSRPNSSGGISELSVMLPIWLTGFGIGAAGIALIVAAYRKR